MSTIILNYTLTSESVSNPDGSLPTTFTGCTIVSGPGNTALGAYGGALSFGDAGKTQVHLPASQFVAQQQFCVRLVFRADAAVAARQSLVECNALPFSLFLDTGTASSDFKVVVEVAPTAHAWSGTTSDYFIDLKVGTWYLIDLIYDVDTVALAVNGTVLSVHAYPDGTIDLSHSSDLFIGTSVDGAGNHFPGSMAALQLHSGIPPELETQVDEKRNSAEWFISFKYELIKPTMNFGIRKEKFSYDPTVPAYIQHYDDGLIMYTETIGVAFEMHGAILGAYLHQRDKAALGYLVSDECNTRASEGRKNLFSKGGIYWSGHTGAVPVSGQIYLDYESMGEEHIGLPLVVATAIAGGWEQIFEQGRMYYKASEPRAFEVHGAILSKFLDTGGVQSWGYPVSNESDVTRDGAVIGRSGEFEGCTIYWSSASGAFEVHGDIRRKYRDIKGPLSALGFPTSDEHDIPNAPAPARGNTFEQGSILWFGGLDLYVCYPFRIFLGTIDSQEEEGIRMGQNDLYLHAILEDSGHEIFRKSFPGGGGYFEENNIQGINEELPFTITPNNVGREVTLTVDIWEHDDTFGADDDHLGVYTKTLSMANAWGLRENQGIFDTGSFDKINNMSWSVRANGMESSLSDVQKWWGVKNFATPAISYSQYAAAFRDVDSDPELWDIADKVELAFYELVAKGIAEKGNCFGMSLEAIYARKHRSLFSLPLDRFQSWDTIRNEVNVKHQYQVGAEAIWWFVGELLSGRTHDPIDVFRSTQSAFLRGDDPVLCVAQNQDFTGAPHVLLPVGWDTSGSPWRLLVCDPNFPGAVLSLFVDPNSNEFWYDGGSSYRGREWSGGRMHYMPYSVLCGRPRTPVWDAIQLILAGTIIIVGSDARTETLTDERGVDLNAFGSDAIALMKKKRSLDNKFVSCNGFAGRGGVFASEVYVRRQLPSQFRGVNPRERDTRPPAGIPLDELRARGRLPASLRSVLDELMRVGSVNGRNIRSLASDPAFVARLDSHVAVSLRNVLGLGSAGRNIRHLVVGTDGGDLQYMVKSSLSHMNLTAPLRSGEPLKINLNDLETHSRTMQLTTISDKLIRFELENRLGVGKDRIKLVLDRVPASAAKGLQINARPGLGGVDIVGGEHANVDVSVETIIDGKLNKRDYAVELDGGLRLRPSTIFARDELKVGKIEQLFGPMMDTSLLSVRP